MRASLLYNRHALLSSTTKFYLQVKTGLGVVRNEGVAALWSGLGPSLARGFFFGGVSGYTLPQTPIQAIAI